LGADNVPPHAGASPRRAEQGRRQHQQRVAEILKTADRFLRRSLLLTKKKKKKLCRPDLSVKMREQLPKNESRRPRTGGTTRVVIGFVGLVVLATVFIGTAAVVLERSDAIANDGLRSRIQRAERRMGRSAERIRKLSTAAASTAAGVIGHYGDGGSDDAAEDEAEADGAVGAVGSGGVGGGTADAAAAVGGLQPHPDPACAALIRETSDVMFMIVGGRGYHDVRVRVMLRSWARCVAHVLVFTDPSLDVGEYLSAHRTVYLLAGDAWRRR